MSHNACSTGRAGQAATGLKDNQHMSGQEEAGEPDRARYADADSAAPGAFDAAPLSGSATVQHGSMPTSSAAACWPALVLFGSGPQTGTETAGQLLDIMQPGEQPSQQQLVAASTDIGGEERTAAAAAATATAANMPSAAAEQTAATVSAEAQPLGPSEATPGPTGPWPALHLLNSNCEYGSEAGAGTAPPTGTDGQQAPAGAGPAMPACTAIPNDSGRSGDDWADELDDLIMEEQELQQQQQLVPPAVPLGADYGWADELDDLLMEEQQLQHAHQQAKQQQQQQQPVARPGSPPAAAGMCNYVAGIDLDAELDELDELDRTYETRKQCNTVAGSGMGAGDGLGVDFGDELDDLFEQQGAAADVCEPVSQMPRSTTLKPATLHSLGMGAAAAARHTAAALAALAAAVVPPKQLASAVSGPCLTVTGSTGQRVYCQLEAARPQGKVQPAAEPAVARRGGSSSSSSSRSRLLAQPIEALLDTLAEKRRQEVLAEFEATHAMAAELQQMVAEARGQEGDAGAQQPEEQQHTEQQQQDPAVQRQLWVDKYAPRSFLSLLSEPRVNREVAAWVARWNKQKQQQQQQLLQAGGGKPGTSLHGKQPARQQQQQEVPAAGQGNSSKSKTGVRGGSHQPPAAAGGSGSGPLAKGFDAARYQAAKEARAAAKILLVVGPPGTGKTTLAHVVAQHCGFRVVEINASDERTATSLTRRITDVAQMQSVIDGTHRPPCIVLDELDGAAAGSEAHSAVSALVKLITGDGSSKRGKRGGKKSAAGSSTGLGVPIIATANDAYAPCLRPLRDIAGIYHFKAPGPEKLIARLAAIAAAEGLAMDRQALSLLVERSGCDVRTCINTLQLLARQAASSAHSSSQRKRRVRITARAVCSSGVFGVKDVSHTPLVVLNELLTGNSKSMASRLQQLVASAAPGSSSSSSGVPAAVAAHLQQQVHYDMLLDLAEHELVQCGLQEALPDAVGLDVDMSSTLAAAEALAEADMLLAGSTAAASATGRGMVQYVPACLMKAARLLRREQNGLAGSSTVQWPRAQAQCSAVAAANRALLRSWRASAPAAAARQLGCGYAGVLELAPAVAGLSRPGGAKAGSRQLLSAQQAAVLEHVVGCLVSYGCTYSFPSGDEEQQPLSPPYAAAPGQPLLRPAPLSPEIDTLHCYSCLGSSSARAKAAVPLVVRQMLSQSISTANITRIEQARHHDQPQCPNAAGRPAAGSALFGTMQTAQGPGGKAPVLHHTAAAKAAVMPAVSSKPAKGCWLDALKARTAPKRKAPAAAATEPTSSKRPATAAAEPGGLAAVSYDVLYKFNEGYTNAVKRPMKVEELLD